ncbi:MAG: RluA family pseudouridine synthase [Candidatus Pacebacteria bacterium]|nr:RluA family pseudouridine synthase [Candidatus Paceibacterota bacterium]
MEPIVIYQEDDFLVINKPAGLIVHCASPKLHESEGGPHEESVVSWLLKNYPEVATVGDDPESRAGIVHRLDRDTSGVMIIPRTQEAFLFFKNLFQTKTVHKTYMALVYGAPKDVRGTIDKPIGLNSGTVKRTVHIKNAKMVKDAVTDYEVIKTFEIDGIQVSLVRVNPRTGRTHQIRVHMASINCWVVGDALYGPKKQAIKISRQFLHADSIEFPTPRGNRLTISADMPEELAALLR